MSEIKENIAAEVRMDAQFNEGGDVTVVVEVGMLDINDPTQRGEDGAEDNDVLPELEPPVQIIPVGVPDWTMIDMMVEDMTARARIDHQKRQQQPQKQQNAHASRLREYKLAAEGEKTMQEIRDFQALIVKAKSYWKVVEDARKKMSPPDSTVPQVPARQTMLGGIRRKPITFTGAQKNVMLQWTQKAEHAFNRIAAQLRNKHNVSTEFLPNACNGHHVKSNRMKAAVLEGYCPAIVCEVDLKEEPVISLHRSRRRNCTVPISMLENCLGNYLGLARLGKESETIMFGTDRPNKTVSHADNIVIPCGCIPPNGSTPCGRFILANDPALLRAIPVESREKYLSILQERQVDLLRTKYGGDIIAFCQDPQCRLSTVGFIIDGELGALQGRAKDVHHRERKCPQCAISWCNECKVVPYHDKQICPGPIVVDVTLSVEEAIAYRRDNKACPKCAVTTFRIDGCDHMRCRCGTHWCWRCREIRNERDPYTHKCIEGPNIVYDTRRHITDH